MGTKFHLCAEIGNSGDKRTLSIAGRDAWALSELVQAGETGCTPIDNPGPRWSAYVHALRHEYGLKIETVHEAHDGTFSGTHARYILKTPVRIIEVRRDREAA